MLKVTGPAVQAVQVPFLEDWHWAGGDTFQLDWTPQAAPCGDSRKVPCLPTGPADRFETCALLSFLHATGTARRCSVRLAVQVARLLAPVQ